MITRAGTLDAWLRKEAASERRRVTLEDVLVFGGFRRYVAHRIGRFVVTRCCQLLLHVCELWLLFIFADTEIFVAAAAIALGAQAATAAWWGGLESLRAGVRTRASDGRFAAIGGWVAQWMFAAGLLGSAIAGVTLLFAVRAVIQAGFDVGTAYVTSRLFGLAIEIVVRTFHNGAYALQRVYQPTWSLLAPSLVRGGLLLALWPLLAVWALPVASLVSTIVAAAVTVRFARCTYEVLGIRWNPRDQRRRHRLHVSLRDAGTFAAAAFANLVANTAHLLALALLSLSTGAETLWLDLLVYVVLAAPMLDAAAGWPRLFYPDLFAVGDWLLLHYLRLLQGQLIKWAPVVGTVLWLPTLGVVWLIPYREDLLPVAMLTWLFFLARARLAAVQMIGFCARRYASIAVLALVLAAAAGIALLNAGEHIRWLAAALALCALVAPLPQPRPEPPASLLPLAALVARAKSIPGLGTWVVASFRPGRLLHGPQVLLHRFVRRIGTAGIHNDRMILWWEPEARARRGDARLVETFLPTRWRSSRGTAAGALLTLESRIGLLMGQRRRSLDDLIADFERQFPDGVCARPGRAADTRIRDLLSWRERQGVLDEAIRHVYGRRPRSVLPVDVSALVEDGCIAGIFLVPRSAHHNARRAWRRRVRDAGITNAFVALHEHTADPVVTIAPAPVAATRTS